MAWDPAKQFISTDRGSNREYGEVTLAGGTVEVPTNLSTVLAAIVTYKEDPTTAAPLWCDCTITAGCVTITNGDPGSAKTVNYEFIGLP
jgi:hypothetical protein